MNPFNVEVPMKDHPLVISVKHIEDPNTEAYDLFYCEGLCGTMLCNEHNIWIYKPHQHAALLLDADHIQHLGKAIADHRKSQEN